MSHSIDFLPGRIGRQTQNNYIESKSRTEIVRPKLKAMVDDAQAPPEIIQISSYSTQQGTEWLKCINLPQPFHQYIRCPSEFPKTAELLRILMKC